MIELFVERQTVDIDKGFSTLLTLAIDDIKDFGAKNSTFSKTIIIPGTKNNNYLFGNIFNISANNAYSSFSQNIGFNFNPAIGAAAYIFADNMQIFKGVLRMLQITIDNDAVEYEVAVFGELGGFAATMGNKRLEDLDFSAYNHNYTYANIINRAALGTGAGYIYPNNIDYGNYSVGKHDWQFRTMRPALHVKEYIDKIFAAANYTYDCALFNTARFKGLIVPNNTKKLQRLSSQYLNVAQSGIYVYTADGVYTTGAIPFNIQNSLGQFTPLFSNTNFEYFGTTVTAVVRLEFDYNVNLLNLNLINVALNAGATTQDFNFLFNGSGSKVIEFSATLNTNDIINTVVSYDDPNIAPDTSSYIEISNAKLTFSVTNSLALAEVPLNGAIDMNFLLPKNILQKDFLSSVVKLFNLYIFEDYENDKALKIMPFTEFYLSAPTTDWSNKVDRSKPMVIKPMSELNSRYFEFSYKSDSDFFNDLYKKRYNETYSSLKFDSEFEFANESTKVELIFAGTVLVGYTGEDKIYSTIFKKSGDVGTGFGEEQVDSVIRILQTKLIEGISSYAIKNGATVLGSLTDYVYAGHLDDPDAPSDDLNFGVPKELFFDLTTGNLTNTQFNTYWDTYMAEITDKDSKLLTATFKLDKKDIYQINFATLIYIDGNLFRINKIIDYNATKEDVCKVELLKIINRF